MPNHLRPCSKRLHENIGDPGPTPSVSPLSTLLPPSSHHSSGLGTHAKGPGPAAPAPVVMGPGPCLGGGEGKAAPPAGFKVGFIY